MSAAAEPSPVQQAASPVAGGWVGFSGLQKVGLGAAAVVGLAVLVAMPDLFGTPAKPAPTAAPPRTTRSLRPSVVTPTPGRTLSARTTSSCTPGARRSSSVENPVVDTGAAGVAAYRILA